MDRNQKNGPKLENCFALKGSPCSIHIPWYEGADAPVIYEFMINDITVLEVQKTKKGKNNQV